MLEFNYKLLRLSSYLLLNYTVKYKNDRGLNKKYDVIENVKGYNRGSSCKEKKS